MNGSSIVATSPAGRSDPALRGVIVAGREGLSAIRGNSTLLVVFGLLVASWIFDFRTSSDSSLSIFLRVYLGIYVAAFGLFLVFDRNEHHRIPGLVPFLGAVTLFLIVAFSTGLFSGQTLAQMFALATPALIYMSAAYATARAAMTQNPFALRRLLAVLCVGYVIAGVVVQRAIGGELDLATVRYQILTGATLPAIGYLECLLLFGLILSEWAALAAGFVVIFLSVTRTYLIAALAQFMGLLPGATRLISPRLLALTLAGLVFLAGLTEYGAFGLDRWSERLFNVKTNTGEDVTLYTRESEWNFMGNAFLRGGRTIMVGNGLASETTFYFPREIGGGSSRSIGFGHNQHLSILFMSGLLGGGMLLFMQFLQGIQSLQLLMRLSRLRERHSNVLFLAAWGAVIIIGVIATTFFSSALNNRSASLWYGLGTGLFLGARARFLRERDMAQDVASSATTWSTQSAANAPPPAVARRRNRLTGASDAIDEATGGVAAPSRASSLPPAVERRRRRLAATDPRPH
ncbi:hypothetical protein [Novosphingobium sp.]|uniref:hypothetical protein n=1 Tax=Novosphingobium sp. TaxID=1874826 RepID=UPI0038B6B5CD|nr:hypothetical protein [Pseudomonadota bacterium]